jgi:hypothetical protein
MGRASQMFKRLSAFLVQTVSARSPPLVELRYGCHDQ